LNTIIIFYMGISIVKRVTKYGNAIVVGLIVAVTFHINISNVVESWGSQLSNSCRVQNLLQRSSLHSYFTRELIVIVELNIMKKIKEVSDGYLSTCIDLRSWLVISKGVIRMDDLLSNIIDLYCVVIIIIMIIIFVLIDVGVGSRRR